MSDMYKKRLKEIIDNSFHTLEMKLANGGVVSHNEASFQLELAYILKVFGKLYEFAPDEKFDLQLEKKITLNDTSIKSSSKNARVDIWMTFGNEQEYAIGAIELKFFKKENHREPNNRYDVFKDISNLEAYKANGTDLNYLFISTNHSHYVNQAKYSTATQDFDFRHGSSYSSGQVLQYKTATNKSDVSEIVLKGNYQFEWSKPTSDLFFLKVEV